MAKLSIVMGTRPEIIKLSPIIHKLNKSKVDLIFSGQHYDYSMGLKFIDELKLPKPDFKLKLTFKNPAMQIGEIIQKFSDIFSKTRNETVIVQGDTNTVLAGALAGLKSKIPVSHVEAGLRSFDWRMTEEHNRITTDHISELLFAPTLISKKNLLQEKVHGKIFVTGNTVMDAINFNLKLAEKNASIPIDYNDFVLVTLHRAENVDNRKSLGEISKALLKCEEQIVFPLHPRTKKRMIQFGYFEKIKKSNNINLLTPVGYFEMLLLMKKCKFILSDSGGIIEEATSPQIKKKTLVVRKTTDRPEAVSAGMSELVGLSENNIIKSIRRFSKNPEFPRKNSPYGTGNSSGKILKIINDNL